MKKLFFTLVLALGLQAAFGQAGILPVEVEIDKVRRSGFSMNTEVSPRVVEEAIKQEFSKYGRVETARGGLIRVPYARLPFNTGVEQPLLLSRLESRRGQTTVFMCVDLGNGVYVGSTHPNAPDLQQMMARLHQQFDFQQQVQGADRQVEEATGRYRDVTRRSERINKTLKDNRSERDRLLKRLGENDREWQQLRADSTQMIQEVNSSLRLLDDQKRNAEAIKNNRPREN